MPTLITTSTYTQDEDFTGAAKVVPELGDAPNVLVTLKDLEAMAASARRETRRRSMRGEEQMKEITLADVETAVKTIAATALKNEQYFCELDSYAGDADFGVSLATGFRAIEQEWNELDRSSIGSFCSRSAWSSRRTSAAARARSGARASCAPARSRKDRTTHHARGSRQDADGRPSKASRSAAARSSATRRCSTR